MKKFLGVLSTLVLAAVILLPGTAMAAGAARPPGDGGPFGAIWSSAAGTPIGDPGPLGGNARTDPVGDDQDHVGGLLADWLSWRIDHFVRMFGLSGTSHGSGDGGPVGGESHSGTRDPIGDSGPGG